MPAATRQGVVWTRATKAGPLGTTVAWIDRRSHTEPRINRATKVPREPRVLAAATFTTTTNRHQNQT
jgi:hypothetical protein